MHKRNIKQNQTNETSSIVVFVFDLYCIAKASLGCITIPEHTRNSYNGSKWRVLQCRTIGKS